MAEDVGTSAPGLHAFGGKPGLKRLKHRIMNADRSGKLAMAIALIGVLSGVTTFLVISGITPYGHQPQLVELLLLVNLVFLVLLVLIIGSRLLRLWIQMRRGQAGSILHIRLVGIFTGIAIVPASIVALFSLVTLNLGLSAWFNERISAVIDNSVEVAEAYVEEHKKAVGTDVLSMARLINLNSDLYFRNKVRFADFFDKLTEIRGLPEAYIITENKRVLLKAGLSPLAVYSPPPDETILRAQEGGIVTGTENNDQLRALIRLEGYGEAFLYVSRDIDARVLVQVSDARAGKLEYQTLEEQRSGIEGIFAAIFLGIVFLILLSAVSLGLWLANLLVTPVTELVRAAEKVRSGDLTTRVHETEGKDEIAQLSRTFNRMTGQMESQQSALLKANRQLDRRSRFTEAVLAGVTAGIIGLNMEGRVNLQNSSALDLLEVRDADLIGRDLAEVVPELKPLLDTARISPTQGSQGQIQITRQGHRKTLLVQVTVEQSLEEAKGFVVTFDDVSQLVSAQRMAAWADVARRIAHEIKNPLTPIQLSAERLKHRYAKQIHKDKDVYLRYLDTITRQVGDIGRMVEEFSSFSRLPAPVFRRENLAGLIKDAVFLQEAACPHIEYVTDIGSEIIPLRCDRRQIGQVLTNILKNAAESIEGRISPTARGVIEVRLHCEHSILMLDILDNGKGFPGKDRHLLIEPYVTTRGRGTGLGLAIVRKIMEDHGGAIQLRDRPAKNNNEDTVGGAMVRLTFRQVADTTNGAEGQVLEDTKENKIVKIGEGYV